MQERSEEDTTNTNFNFNIKFSSQIPGQKKKKRQSIIFYHVIKLTSYFFLERGGMGGVNFSGINSKRT